MHFFADESAFREWQRSIPLVEFVSNDYLPPDTYHFPSIDVLYIDPDHLLIRYNAETGFCPVERCATEMEGNFTWYGPGERIYARFLHWQTNGTVVTGATILQAKAALQAYQKGPHSKPSLQSTHARRSLLGLP